MNTLENLGYKLTFSGPTPNPVWGKVWIHAQKVDGPGFVCGYGEDEAAAVANAVQTLENHKDEPPKSDRH